MICRQVQVDMIQNLVKEETNDIEKAKKVYNMCKIKHAI